MVKRSEEHRQFADALFAFQRDSVWQNLRQVSLRAGEAFRRKPETPEESEGMVMMETIGNVITAIDDAVWGWWLIILLLGTHIFMTFKTGFIQWKCITRGIKLSVTKHPDAEAEVS